MKNTIKIMAIAILLGIALTILTGCNFDTIVGTWEGATQNGIKTTFTFGKDGNVTYSNEYGIESEGTYELKENGIITITLQSWEKPKEYRYEVKNNKLNLRASDNYSPSYIEMEKK